MSSTSNSDAEEKLCAAIRQALALADELNDTLVSALLGQALDAARCDNAQRIF